MDLKGGQRGGVGGCFLLSFCVWVWNMWVSSRSRLRRGTFCGGIALFFPSPGKEIYSIMGPADLSEAGWVCGGHATFSFPLPFIPS